MSLYKCYVCNNGTYKIRTDPDYKICADCLPFVHYVTKMAEAYACYLYSDHIYKRPYREDSGARMRILVKHDAVCASYSILRRHDTEVLTSVVNLIIGEITRIPKLRGEDMYYTQPYAAPAREITDYWDATDYYAEGYAIYDYYLPIQLRKCNHKYSLARLAATKCAHMGRLEGLTDDAIDLVIAIDALLAIRFLF